MENLFTIGHSQHEINYFIRLLRENNVNFVLDVRSTPYSRYAEQFNKENISNSLQKFNIQYFFMGKFFGARQEDLSLYNDEGYLDFQKVVRTENFNKGMKSVLIGLERGNRIAFMCTEKDPIDCHRAIMVSRAFAQNGIEVKHILSDGSIETQKELDNRLLNKYFPDRGQLSLFNYKNIKSDEEYIVEAYRKRNEEIGYRIKYKESLVG